MNNNFDIIEYLSGITQFTFDKAVLKRTALERGVYDVSSYDELDIQTRDLLRADLLYTAYISPNVWSSSTHSHGSYTKTIGSLTINAVEKERLYNSFIGIYRKYNDSKLAEFEDNNATVQWL